MEKKKTIFFVVILILTAFILGCFSFALWQKHCKKTAAKPLATSETLALNALPLNAQDFPFSKRFVGYVIPIHEAQVQPFISGYIEQIMIKGGERVRKGDILVVLQQEQYHAELAAAAAEILKAEAALKNASIYYERIKKAGVKTVSPTELDNAQTQFLSAQADFEQAQANYALAKVNFDYTVIRAPIDGIVGDVSLTKGNYVSPTSGVLFSIVQYNPIRVVFSITDKEYLQELNKTSPFAGDEILLQAANGETFPHHGVFRYTDNTINKNTNTIAVYVDFENIGQILTPNAYVTILVRKIFKYSVQIPKNLVSLENDGNYVYLIRNGKINKEKINILASENTYFIVENTFQKGDVVLVDKFNPAYLNKTITPVLEKTANSRPDTEDK